MRRCQSSRPTREERAGRFGRFGQVESLARCASAQRPPARLQRTPFSGIEQQPGEIPNHGAPCPPEDALGRRAPILPAAASGSRLLPESRSPAAMNNCPVLAEPAHRIGVEGLLLDQRFPAMGDQHQRYPVTPCGSTSVSSALGTGSAGTAHGASPAPRATRRAASGPAPARGWCATYASVVERKQRLVKSRLEPRAGVGKDRSHVRIDGLVRFHEPPLGLPPAHGRRGAV